MEYRRYRLGVPEMLFCIAAGFVLSLLLAWLFYRSWIGMAMFPLVLFCFCREYKKRKAEKQKDRLLQEFKDGIQAVSASLLAGYSIENAWREAEKELRALHGEHGMMYMEFVQMNAAIRMSRPLERVLQEFAERSGCGEIESFAEVFFFAKRSGGDFVGIIHATVTKLVGRIEVEREIATVLAGKKLEGRMMQLMPILILSYFNISSGSFLEPLYGNGLGAAVMSGAIGVYAVAFYLSERILDIQI